MRLIFDSCTNAQNLTYCPSCSDIELVALLDQFDAREVLHVTFGSALAQFGGEIHTTLRQFHDEYTTTLATHFSKHLAALKQ
ncbi:MAG: hypothetical protein IT331_22885 [Anaerolineae bacterium]|nr:hypothetical protein [Anaerolineae bacterium]